jgi:D-alanyl-D-alanine carboxypeptidase (penicillin-binding protein 5/6)
LILKPKLVNSLERTLITKSGYDHGWEVVVEEGADRVVLASALHRVRAEVTGGAGWSGTTTLAGQCLVASGRRGGDHLFVAVLGSATDARFVDARNLFRWAWERRARR